MKLIIDTRDAEKLARDLRTYKRSAVPFATRNVLNDLAFEAREQWRREMESEFILRNKWTQGSVRVDRAQGINLSLMRSTVGSVADYMGTQEHGGNKRGSGKHGARVPTAVAAGQAQGSRPRKRPVRGPNRMAAIQLARIKHRPGQSKRQQVAASIAEAVRKSKRWLFLDADHDRQGFYKIIGGKSRPRLQLVWDMSAGSVKIPASKTLAKATARATRKTGVFAQRRLAEQLRKHRAFGY